MYDTLFKRNMCVCYYNTDSLSASATETTKIRQKKNQIETRLLELIMLQKNRYG